MLSIVSGVTMKTILLISAFLATSMTSVPDEFVDRHQCLPQESVSCVVDLSLVCPPGYLDGCINEESRTHRCVPVNDGPLCSIPLKMACPENFIDGCDTGESDTHLCVPVKKDLCRVSQEMLQCPSGFEDACR